jgi:hypothetical protein
MLQVSGWIAKSEAKNPFNGEKTACFWGGDWNEERFFWGGSGFFGVDKRMGEQALPGGTGAAPSRESCCTEFTWEPLL